LSLLSRGEVVVPGTAGLRIARAWRNHDLRRGKLTDLKEVNAPARMQKPSIEIISRRIFTVR
jgi:hypothetical protein